MTVDFNALPSQLGDDGRYNAVVDTPMGSRNKCTFDSRLGVWRLKKILPLGATFPFDFGFIPSTKGEDGDPIDVMVLMEEPSFVGCVLPVRLIGVIKADQTDGQKTVRNDRLLAMVETKNNKPRVQTIAELDEITLDQIEHFFRSYNEAQGRLFRVLGRGGSDEARRLVEAASVTPKP